MADETGYRLNFTAADGYELVGRTADITEWGDDEGSTEITWAGARVTGVIPHLSCLTITTTAPAPVTDTETGATLGARPPQNEINLGFAWIRQVKPLTNGDTPDA